MLQNIIIILIITASSIANVSAQQNQSSASTDINITEATTPNQNIFFTDSEESTYYIDFEAVGSSVSQIILRSATNEIILKEDTLELPENTIYGINLDALQPGSYSIELMTFNDDGIIQYFNKKKHEGNAKNTLH